MRHLSLTLAALLCSMALTAAAPPAPRPTPPPRPAPPPAPRPTPPPRPSVTPPTPAPRPGFNNPQALPKYKDSTPKSVNPPSGSTGQTRQWQDPKGNPHVRTKVEQLDGKKLNVAVTKNDHRPTIDTKRLDEKGRLVQRDHTIRMDDGKLRTATTKYDPKTKERQNATVKVHLGDDKDGKPIQRQYDVRFKNDKPDFSPHAKHTVTIKQTGDRERDNRLADEEAARRGLPPRTAGYTWHHHEGTKQMQLVPTELHSAIGHSGGVAEVKGRK